MTRLTMANITEPQLRAENFTSLPVNEETARMWAAWVELRA